MVAEMSLKFCDNLNLKRHRVTTMPYIIGGKTFSNQYQFSKAKCKTKLNHEVLGLCQRVTALLFGVIGRLYIYPKKHVILSKKIHVL